MYSVCSSKLAKIDTTLKVDMHVCDVNNMNGCNQGRAAKVGTIGEQQLEQTQLRTLPEEDTIG